MGTSKHADYDAYLEGIPYSDELKEGAKQAAGAARQAVDTLNPFSAPVHKAVPQQANSTSGETSWFTDFKWRNPFSDSITFDEDRSVLPPEQRRPTIYTYFDPKEKGKDEKVLDAELELVNVWRRAWWAKGFKPMVLGPGEAMSNPLYQKVVSMKLGQDMQFDLLRWLAWGTMGTGILCNWLAVPMAQHDDTLLNFLRHGDFPALTRFGDLGHGIFVGSKTDIERIIKTTIDTGAIRDADHFINAIPAGLLKVEESSGAIAFYDGDTISSNYGAIKEKFNDQSTMVEGLTNLAYLINSHLHTTWQAQFPRGIYVLKPLPSTSTNLVEPAVDIAKNLSQCSWSPLPNSCPPNIKECRTCVASTPLSVSLPPYFRNRTDVFTIATVPHPYTLNCLFHQRNDLNGKFVRRQTTRDKWILEATAELMGTAISSYARLVRFKDAVAGELSQTRTLWLTAEHPNEKQKKDDGEELDWIFGFQLPRHREQDGKSFGPVPGPERRPPPPKPEFHGPAAPSDNELEAEKKRLELSQQFLYTQKRKERLMNKRLQNFVEAWNLADTEAWKFVRAFNARRIIERRKWEDEEKAFLGQGLWDRLVDKIL